MRPPYLFSIPLQFRSNHFKPPYHHTPPLEIVRASGLGSGGRDGAETSPPPYPYTPHGR